MLRYVITDAELEPSNAVQVLVCTRHDRISQQMVLRRARPLIFDLPRTALHSRVDLSMLPICVITRSLQNLVCVPRVGYKHDISQVVVCWPHWLRLNARTRDTYRQVLCNNRLAWYEDETLAYSHHACFCGLNQAWWSKVSVTRHFLGARAIWKPI